MTHAHGIILDEHLRVLWFTYIAGDADLTVTMHERADAPGYQLTARVCVRQPDPHGSITEQVRYWRTTLTEPDEPSACACARDMIDAAKHTSIDRPVYEICRDEATVDEFAEALERLPFVKYTRRMHS